MDTVLYDSHGFEYEMDVVNHGLNTPTIYVAGDLLSEGAKMRRAWEAEQLRSTAPLSTFHTKMRPSTIRLTQSKKGLLSVLWRMIRKVLSTVT